jgi:hypothetical protein
MIAVPGAECGKHEYPWNKRLEHVASMVFRVNGTEILPASLSISDIIFVDPTKVKKRRNHLRPDMLCSCSRWFNLFNAKQQKSLDKPYSYKYKCLKW